ncbi:hypothetical protein M409DRAFT_54404 [Zasmidium cellare ATCC 36951]|uniref:Uncharacterized protein n=1 Tax=Zasmidium cellare ATCC 36951 TaxID=1080233 RepID=A0A6A6CJ05_ZASCE|nr:uncharacterized protein M409DRAFT_54404 [Zasmidium cellare ATCC 36951]KAF2167217.1 hypothetical protein M409DRAFT_54404 [Zasmidium cellare ATCC 36951]
MDSAHPNPNKFALETTSLHQALRSWLRAHHINPTITTATLHHPELTTRERAQILEEKRKILARQRDGDEILLHPPVPRDEWPKRAYNTRPRRSSATAMPIPIVRSQQRRGGRAASMSVVGNEVVEGGGGDGEWSIWAKTLRRDSKASSNATAAAMQWMGRDRSVSCPIYTPDVVVEAAVMEEEEDTCTSPYDMDMDLEAGPPSKKDYGTLPLPSSSVNTARREAVERARREVVGMYLVGVVVVGLVLVLGVGWVVAMAWWEEVAGEEGVEM